MTEHPRTLSDSAKWLGYAGLLPQLFAVLMQFDDGSLRWIAMAGGYGYAALIFSFLGGVWWGVGIASSRAPKWLFLAAVAPSLIALGTYLPWTWGWVWPGPSLWVLAGAIAVSPLVDRALSHTVALPEGWLKLRLHLSAGLALMTALLALA